MKGTKKMSEEKGLTIFKNETFGSIQVIDRDGEPWFVAKDVAEALGYNDAAYAYKTHCNSPVLLDSEKSSELKIQNPHPRGTYIINESDLYRLVLRSKKQEAVAFSDWITEEVIPSIRKTGGYTLPTSKRPTPDSQTYLDWMTGQLQAATRMASVFGLEGNMALLAANNAVRNLHNVDCLQVMGTPQLESKSNVQYMTPSELGSRLNMTAQKFNKELEKHGLQKQVRNGNKLNWLVTEKGKGFCQLLDTNKRHSNGAPVTQVKWSTDILTDVLGEIP
jgi:prophage antirepressor-like protein/predicted transcriptional regulator